jgi:hypothetical protein
MTTLTRWRDLCWRIAAALKRVRDWWRAQEAKPGRAFRYTIEAIDVLAEAVGRLWYAALRGAEIGIVIFLVIAALGLALRITGNYLAVEMPALWGHK